MYVSIQSMQPPHLPAIKEKPFTTLPAYLVTRPTTSPPNACHNTTPSQSSMMINVCMVTLTYIHT